LDPVTGALFLLGLGMCVRRIRHWFYQLLLLWLATTMLSGILSLDFEAPQAARSVGALAPLMLIAALPLVLLARTVWSTVDALLRPRLRQAALVTGALATAVGA